MFPLQARLREFPLNIVGKLGSGLGLGLGFGRDHSEGCNPRAIVSATSWRLSGERVRVRSSVSEWEGRGRE
eukprot:1068570-Amorphochlora_amoeboformis.AAC.1